ncbi:hypothetical protein M0657_010141 [Pyricularia oryzae]|uniref:SH3 domain-containing protein n=2 Tax=Pyricularia oryzae TaxID=318829 RepID=A0AA97PG82_PYRO3|nr:hypothetical protein OOU_Y34scaffold00946g7 [Pyricularia oryzae Y34]KAI7913162.1 hypothetical protein M0657_010141 [Pyricularia oryzae]KAI7917300.1 hypothetical protein M9X92_007462 [Pyricularia oryzae]
MVHRRHMQLHQRQKLRERNSQEVEAAHLEDIALKLEKRQRGSLKDAWEDFTDGIRDAFTPPPKTTKSEDDEKPATKPQGGRTQATTTHESAAKSTPTPTSRNIVTKTDEQVKGTPLLVAPSESKTSEASSTPTPQDPTLPASIVAPSQTQSPASGTDAPLAVAKDTPTLPIAPSSTPTPTSAASKAEDSGSAAAKAGIAFGIIGGLLVISLLIFFLFKKRKQQMERRELQAEDEKFSGAFAAIPNSNARRSSRHQSHRLSLAPLNRQPTLPTNLSGAPPLYPKNSDSAWERPRTGNSANNPANPFGNHAETMEQAAVAPAAGAGLARKQSIRKDAPHPLDLTLPPVPEAAGNQSSPAGTEYSAHEMSPGVAAVASPGAAAIAAAGGPAQSAVHRVQLDFKPTMEDEMELKAGTLVRLLFEYDDGWALCIRLDRSQQGVVPRTCLSTRPLKPRAGGPPGQRPGPPVNAYRGANPPVAMQTQGYKPPSPVGSMRRQSPTEPSHPQTQGYKPPSPVGSMRRQSPAEPSPMRTQGYKPPSPVGSMRRQSPIEEKPMPPTPPQEEASLANGQPGHSRAKQSIERKPVPGQAM